MSNYPRIEHRLGVCWLAVQSKEGPVCRVNVAALEQVNDTPGGACALVTRNGIVVTRHTDPEVWAAIEAEHRRLAEVEAAEAAARRFPHILPLNQPARQDEDAQPGYPPPSAEKYMQRLDERTRRPGGWSQGPE